MGSRKHNGANKVPNLFLNCILHDNIGSLKTCSSFTGLSFHSTRLVKFLFVYIRQQTPTAY